MAEFERTGASVGDRSFFGSFGNNQVKIPTMRITTVTQNVGVSGQCVFSKRLSDSLTWREASNNASCLTRASVSAFKTALRFRSSTASNRNCPALAMYLFNSSSLAFSNIHSKLEKQHSMSQVYYYPNLLQVGAPLPRRTAVPQHRRHQTRTLPLRGQCPDLM